MIENGQPDGGFFLLYGGNRIPFTVEFRKRAKLAITVHPNARVQVAAPSGSSLEVVLARVEKRAGWISKQIRYFEQYQPTQPPPRFVSGETHLFLGRQYRLKVRVGEPKPVKLLGRFFFVWTNSPNDTAVVQEQLKAWFRDHAAHIFEHRLKAGIDSTRSLGLRTVPKLLVRTMERRWGSCTKAGNILLNVKLIKAPIHCLLARWAAE